MKEFVKNLYDNLLEDLAVYADLGTLPVRKVTGAIAVIGEAVGKLKDWIIQEPFATSAEEIQFFKYDKPAFVAEQFYAMEIFTIEAGRPLNDLDLLKAFYEQELKYVRRFLEQNKFLFAYYQADMKELDHLLFIRGAKPADIPVPDSIGLDPLFNTCCDNLFAKFMAFERLQQYLTGCLYQAPQYENSLQGKQRRSFKWTGDKSNLVEVAYGLYGTMQINGGDVTIAEIIEWLEESLGVSLSRYYRRFSEIKMRKSVSQSKYLDEMREAFLRYIEEGEAFKPKVARPPRSRRQDN
jgi:hypothetical protein